jgi:hypothetical protein
MARPKRQTSVVVSRPPFPSAEADLLSRHIPVRLCTVQPMLEQGFDVSHCLIQLRTVPSAVRLGAGQR